MIYNLNETWIATFPKIPITIINGDRTILVAGHQTGSLVMPGDTVTLCGMVSVPTANITDDAKIYFDVDWFDMKTSTSLYSGAKMTEI